MVAQTQKLITMDTLTLSKIDRCLAIEEEYDNLDNIHLTSEDYEDVSDSYQDKLELQWYKRELEDKYSQLNRELGYINRKLSDKSSRRTSM